MFNYDVDTGTVSMLFVTNFPVNQTDRALSLHGNSVALEARQQAAVAVLEEYIAIPSSAHFDVRFGQPLDGFVYTVTTVTYPGATELQLYNLANNVTLQVMDLADETCTDLGFTYDTIEYKWRIDYYRRCVVSIDSTGDETTDCDLAIDAAMVECENFPQDRDKYRGCNFNPKDCSVELLSGSGDVIQRRRRETVIKVAVTVTTGGTAPTTPLPGNTTVVVLPPQATNITVAAGTTRLVFGTDLAAKAGADYPTETQLSVSLAFADGTTEVGLQTDNRTTFQVLGLAPFTVSSTGKIVANETGSAAEGTVLVTFMGQIVTATISIEVTTTKQIRTQMMAYPTSTGVPVDVLSPIGCTNPLVFQQGYLRLFLELLNGEEKELISNVNFAVDDTSVVSLSLRTATAVKEGNATITGSFHGESNTLDITVPTTQVYVTSINQFQLASGGSTISASASVSANATLSDGRQLPALLSSSSILYNGLLSFSSSVPTAISVDGVTGTLTTLKNYHRPVTITVNTCDGQGQNAVSQTLTAFANLRPGNNDVDLGLTSGLALQPITAGQDLTVDVRIKPVPNMKQFTLRLEWNDPGVAYKSFTKRSGQLKTADANQVESEEVVLVTGLFETPIATSEHLTVSLTFSSDSASGVVDFTGEIVELYDANSTKVASNKPFVAGQVSIEVSGSRRSRRTVQRSKRQATCTADESYRGDADCSGQYNGADQIFLSDYLNERKSNFVTQTGIAILNTVNTCRSSRGLSDSDVSFLDTDGNHNVDLMDLSFMLAVTVRRFHFFSLSYNPPLYEPIDCQLTLSVKLSAGPSGTDCPIVGSRVLLDLADDTATPLEDLLEVTETAVVVGKPNSTQFGGLVEAPRKSLDSSEYVVELQAPVPTLDNLGVSIIQISTSPDPNGVQYLFTDGPDADVRYPGRLEYTAEQLGVSNALVLDQGYNPFKLINTTCLSSASPTPSPTYPLSTGTPTTSPTHRVSTGTPTTSPTMSPTLLPTSVEPPSFTASLLIGTALCLSTGYGIMVVDVDGVASSSPFKTPSKNINVFIQ